MLPELFFLGAFTSLACSHLTKIVCLCPNRQTDGVASSLKWINSIGQSKRRHVCGWNRNRNLYSSVFGIPQRDTFQFCSPSLPHTGFPLTVVLSSFPPSLRIAPPPPARFLPPPLPSPRASSRLSSLLPLTPDSCWQRSLPAAKPMLACAAASPGQQLLLNQITLESAFPTRRRQAMEASTQTDRCCTC